MDPFYSLTQGYVTYNFGIGYGKGFLEFNWPYLVAGAMRAGGNVYALNKLRVGIEEAIQDFVAVNVLGDPKLLNTPKPLKQ